MVLQIICALALRSEFYRVSFKGNPVPDEPIDELVEGRLALQLLHANQLLGQVTLVGKAVLVLLDIQEERVKI